MQNILILYFSELKPWGNGWSLVHSERAPLHIGRLHALYGKIKFNKIIHSKIYKENSLHIDRIHALKSKSWKNDWQKKTIIEKKKILLYLLSTHFAFYVIFLLKQQKTLFLTFIYVHIKILLTESISRRQKTFWRQENWGKKREQKLFKLWYSKLVKYW